MALKRVSPTTPIVIKKVIEGTPGKPGKDGITEVITKTVIEHMEAEQGEKGDIPNHQVRNGEIRFEKPDGTWGEWIEIAKVTSSPGGGGSEAVKYIPVQAAFFKVQRQSLIVGTNIFGVNFAGDVEFILPSGIDKNIIIVVNDESNNASTNNITITTENQ